ncbi:MAG: hypothetical protein ABI318_18220 [Chthoniobacteraceae bacterium]
MRKSRQWTSASLRATLAPRISLAVGADAEGDEHGAIDDTAAVADLFIGGIEDDAGEGGEGRERQLSSSTLRRAAQWLTWVEETEVPQSSSRTADFAGGDALHIHLPAPSGAALRAKAPLFGYLAPLDSARESLRACSLRTPFSRADG